FGTINGVIHAAGLVGEQSFKTIREITADDWDAQFQAKAKGAQVLAEVLREYQPDFCLLQSSLSSILGGLGFSAYAAANQFLDAFSYQQNKKSSTQWISVNWDGWQFDETSEQQGALGAEIAQLSILPDEGAKTFERVFASKGISQILISTGNLQSRINKWIKLETIHQDEEAADGELHSRPNLPTAYVEPETELQKQVASEWQKLLGIEPIGIYDDFFDLGGNSLSGTQLISKMRETFRIELPLRSLFEDATISGVSKLIETAQKESKDSDVGKVADLLKQMENMSDEEAAEALKRKKD
ncbi:MAG: KR domain-containing protein, partial [Calditrichales bacterium]|nr:KR domain-containing protein [Calditrichales bacterium]